MVIWIIGLSGSGKTTLANEIISVLDLNKKKAVLLDGDKVREIFGNDIGYSIKDRRKNADRICQIGKFLDDQGFHVVCPVLSIFPESRNWNRANIKNYYEVFIDTPIEVLINRDSKGIYGKFIRGEIQDVVGLDINFPAPDKPDLVIDNSKTESELLGYADLIARKL